MRIKRFSENLSYESNIDDIKADIDHMMTALTDDGVNYEISKAALGWVYEMPVVISSIDIHVNDATPILDSSEKYDILKVTKDIMETNLKNYKLSESILGNIEILINNLEDSGYIDTNKDNNIRPFYFLTKKNEYILKINLNYYY